MNQQKILFAVGPLSSAFCAMLTVPILAWCFSAEDVGRYSILQIFISLFVVTSALGLDQAYVREFHSVQRQDNRFFQHLMPGLAIIIFVFVLTFSWGAEITRGILGVGSKFLWVVLLVSGTLTFLVQFLTIDYRLSGNPFKFIAAQLLPKALFLISLPILYLLDLAKFLPLSIALMVSAALAIMVIFCIACRWPSSEVFKPVRVEVGYIFRVVKYSFPIMIGAMALWGTLAIDRFSLRFLSSFTELGIYTVSYSIAAIGLIVQNVFSMLWYPEVYREYEETGNYKNFQEVANLLAFILFFIFCCFGLVAPFLHFMLPNEYYVVQYIMPASIIYPLFLVASEVSGVGIGLTRRSVFSMLSIAAAFVVNFILNLKLVPLYGATGAVVASAISFFIYFISKTESSCMVWRPLRRAKLYGIFFVMLAYALLVAMIKIKYLSLVMSLVCFAVMPILFKGEIKEAKSWFPRGLAA